MNQTQLIRDMFKAGKKKKALVKALMDQCGKTEGQANARITAYEKSYGEMGKDDPKLK